MLTNAQSYLLAQRPALVIDADTSDARLKMLADFATADANRHGYETTKAEMRAAYKSLRKSSRKAIKRQSFKLAA